MLYLGQHKEVEPELHEQNILNHWYIPTFLRIVQFFYTQPAHNLSIKESIRGFYVQSVCTCCLLSFILQEVGNLNNEHSASEKLENRMKTRKKNVVNPENKNIGSNISFLKI